jgi:hypothetical protein
LRFRHSLFLIAFLSVQPGFSAAKAPAVAAQPPAASTPAASTQAASAASTPAVAAPSTAAPIPAVPQGEKTPIADFLRTAKADGVLKARHPDREFETGRYSGIPFIRDLELRVRNDGFDWAGQRYTLRLEPRGFGEGGASARFDDAQVRRSEKRNRLLLNRALVDRYFLAIDLLMKQEMKRLNTDMISVSADRIKVLESRKNGEDFDLNDLIEAELDLNKLRTADIDLSKEISVLEHRVAMDLGPVAFAGFDTSGMVSLDAIISLVEKGGFSVDTGHVYLQYLKLGLTLAENRYRLEKAESRQYLSSLSFSYDVGQRTEEADRRRAGKEYDLGRAYILEAGFRIPDLTTGSRELNRRKLEFLSEKEDYEQNKRELAQVMEKDIEDILFLVSQYRYLTARESEVDAKSSLKKYLQLTGVDPLVLLSIKNSQLKNAFKIQEVKYGIILNYIKVMDATGRLGQAPLRNFLSAGNEVMAE